VCGRAVKGLYSVYWSLNIDHMMRLLQAEADFDHPSDKSLLSWLARLEEDARKILGNLVGLG
jgi:hypothetical protein